MVYHNKGNNLWRTIGEKAQEIGSAIGNGLITGKKIYDFGRQAYEFGRMAAPYIQQGLEIAEGMIETAAPLAGLL